MNTNSYASRLERGFADVGQPVAMSREVWQAIIMAYGHLWHINCEPAAPIPLVNAEAAANRARLLLLGILSKDERREGINMTGFEAGRYFSETPPDTAAAPQQAAAPTLGFIGLSDSANFDDNTWTFLMDPGYRVGAGQYLITRIAKATGAAE